MRHTSGRTPAPGWITLLPPDLDQRWPFMLLAASLGLSTVSIALSQIFLGFSTLALLMLGPANRLRLPARLPLFILPLFGFMAWSAVAAMLAPSPACSLVNLKKLLMFLIVPLILLLVRRDRERRLVYGLIVTGLTVSAVYGLLRPPDAADLLRRMHGLVGHHMTFAGQMALGVTLAAAGLLAGRSAIGRWGVLAASLLASLGGLALMFGLTRSAWLGCAAGVLTATAILRPRLLWLAPPALGLLLLAVPEHVRHRAWHMFSLQDEGNAARLDMWRTGGRIVLDRPLVGVGPGLVGRLAYEYGGDPRIGPDFYLHLHNNAIQLAAERGIPALIAWLAFLALAGYPPLRRALSRRRAGDRGGALWPATAVAAVATLFTAGLFEYNFGDTEVLILFLSLITLPAIEPATDDAPP